MGKRVVVQGNPIGSITWDEYWTAWLAHSRTDKTEDAALAFAQEGGFSYRALCKLLGHEPTT